MRSMLIVNNLWGYVSGKIILTKLNQAEWKVKDRKALMLITLSTSQNQITYIKRIEISADAWTELEKVHESKGSVRKAVLYKQLHRTKKGPNQSMTQYVYSFTRTAEQLEEVGIKVSDKL